MTRSFLISAIVFELAAGRAVAAAGDVSPSGSFDDLLARTEHRVEQFWDQFSAVTCTETVEQNKLGDDGKTLIKKSSAYDYLVLLQLSGDDLLVQESRLLQGKPGKESDRPLLSTGGFSTMVLIFHPHFRSSFTFAYEGNDPTTPALGRVRFEHIHGKRSPAVLQLRSREYPIEWRGTAWIERTTGNIARIQADLETPFDDIGLKRLTTEVHYSPAVLAGLKTAPWMPVTAEIEADTTHQHWRNVHTFTAYKQFSVSTDSKTQKIQEGPQQ